MLLITERQTNLLEDSISYINDKLNFISITIKSKLIYPQELSMFEKTLIGICISESILKLHSNKIHTKLDENIYSEEREILCEKYNSMIKEYEELLKIIKG